ncbi:MAG: S8 family serine peptidase, partial [Bdellovibrionia bacterium]
DVINLSLGGLGQVASTGVAIQEAIAADVVIVAASGNSNIVLDANTFMTPASYAATYNGMIAVGSIDAVNGARSGFSNCGNTVVEIAAPGAHNSTLDTSLGGLLSTLPSGTYGRSMGTSMSSPIVAGAVGLAIGLKRSLGHTFTNADVEALMKSTSTTTTTLTPYFQNGKVLNLENLVNTISP